ncbi:hypothetical protein DFH06DRAFT_38601 [Mycena polygramma]|nr:hypothetical protein DFH06DRAFT_38601 [Mycena polygramma]
MPLKRSHISSRVPKPNADLRFQAKGQTAASLADALNNASVQNSKSIPTPVHHPPSSPPTSVPNSRPIVCPSVRLPPSSAATTLPRKKVRRKAAPAITTGPAPSTSTPQGSNSNPALPGIEGQLAMIRETLSAVQADQARQAAELEHMRRTSAPEKVADFAPSSSSTESTIKVVADLVSGLVSAFQQPNPPTNGTGVNVSPTNLD